MGKDPKTFFGHILESAGYIAEDLAGVEKEEFYTNRQKQDSVVRRLEIIGEAKSNIPEDVRRKYPEIPWRDIMDMRNKLIHEYFGVDVGVVWKAATEDVPELKEKVDTILTF